MSDLSISPRASGYRLPAEWEPQRAVWMVWPHEASDFPGKLSAVQWVYCEILHWLSQTGRVELLIATEQHRGEVEARMRSSGYGVERIEFTVLPTNRSWTRDFLPSWVVRGSGEQARLGAVKWQFNGWARYDNFHEDEAAGQRVAHRRTEDCWLPLRAGGTASGAQQPGRFVLEGGSIDSDGQGTLLTTTDCLLGTEFPRNPGLNQARVEAVLSENLAVDRVIWLPGDVAGDDTSGHVDDVARFVAPGRVVVPVETNEADPNFLPLLRARQILEESSDASGRALDVVRLPMPSPRFHEGDRLPATYANFLIANELVLVPTFNDPQDRQALGTFAELFPDRQIVGIHSGDLILGLGALHCSTNHEPDPSAIGVAQNGPFTAESSTLGRR